MQALHVSGQAAEFRDPLPVKGPANGEVDTTEHPFMKLLTRLRNAMKQGEEPVQGALNEGSRLSPESSSKAKSLTGAASLKGTRQEKPDGGLPEATGLQRTTEQTARNGASTALDEVGQKISSGIRESNPLNTKSKTLVSLLGSKTSLKPDGGKAAGAVSGAEPGKDSGVLVDGAFAQAAVPKDQKKLQKLGDNTLDLSTSHRSDHRSGSTADTLAKRRTIGTRGSLDDATIAASGNLNGTLNQASLTRNQNSASSREKADLGNPVDDARTTGRRPSRYSVVDMRLKASAGKTKLDLPSDVKVEGKSGGATAAESNRSGLSGTDAAGRQISNDQPASGFSELTKGIGSESNDKAPTSFADNLAARLRDGGSMDIVRSAQIVLKDGDAGLIRLRLEPESLGGVKIELKMADKQISARIIVESDLAGEAFRSSLDSLRDAFASSGFETTSIEVEVRDGRAGTGDTGRGDTQDDGDEKSRALYTARKAEEFGDAVPSADAAYGRYGVIDLVV